MSDLAAHIRALDPLWVQHGDGSLTNLAPALADLVEACGVHEHHPLECAAHCADPCPTAAALARLADALGVQS